MSKTSPEITIDTDIIRSIAATHPDGIGITSRKLIELCDAVDTLRRQLAGANDYIHKLQKRVAS